MIRALELRLGIRLFHRSHRAIALTEAGRDYLPAIRNAFRQIGEATRRLAAVAESGLLTVSVTPSFAAAWLAPRLLSFQEGHPDIDLQIVSSKALANFDRDGVDVAIRHGLGRYPGLHSERLFAVELVPVAAPALVDQLGLPKHPGDLTAWPHLHDAERQDWHLRLQAQGVTEIGPPHGPAFDDPSLLLTAVLAGQGTALGACGDRGARPGEGPADQALRHRLARRLRLLPCLSGRRRSEAEGRGVSRLDYQRGG
jgi:LysR family glycine cleavage system transcriptional activator